MMLQPIRSLALALALALALVAAASVPPARAAEVPGFDREVRLMAREQPVGQFLEELFGKIGVPVRIDQEIVGTVNGDFAKSASEVFEDITSSFQLTLYYDGAVANVYPSSATTRSIVYLPDALGERVLRNARRMAMTDSRNRLEASEIGLVVTGTERFVEQVEELAEAVRQGSALSDAGRRGAPRAATSHRAADEGAPGENVYRVFRLRYAWADDTTLAVGGQEIVVPGVASLLRALAHPGGMTVMPSVTRRQLERSLPGLRGEGLRSIGSDAEVEPGSAASERADARRDAALETPSAVTGAGASDASIVADSLQNAVVIRDRAERMAGYESLIAALDVEPRMIEIEATIIDLDTDRLRDLGVDVRVDSEDGSVLSNGAIAPGIASGPLDSDRSTGGIVSLILGDETRFLSRIRALESQGAARVVSKPHVITLANVEAVLDTSSTFFVRVEGEEEVDLFDVSVGTTLRVTPHVFEAAGRSQIKLLVSIEDGTTTNERVDAIPIIRNSSINTQALIDGGQSLLIGGLVRESDGSQVSKVPLLGDIPGLGALFRSTSKSSNRVERLFLISPRLSVRTPAGPRHSAPVLWGDESEIIASAPSRTRAANLGLARRDAGYPLPDALPGGGADVALIPDDYDADAEAARLAAEAAAGAPASGSSLRERLLGLPPDARSRQPSAPIDEPLEPPPERAPWLSVAAAERGRAAAAGEAPGAVPGAVPGAAAVSRTAAGGNEPDGAWQVVPGTRPVVTPVAAEGARAVAARPAGGRPVAGRPAEGRSAGARPAESRLATSPPAEGRSAEGRPTEGRPAGPRPALLRAPDEGGWSEVPVRGADARADTASPDDSATDDGAADDGWQEIVR